MDQVLILAALIVPIVIALVQLAKITFTLPKNLVPLVGLVIGIVVGVAAWPFTDLVLPMRLWAGIFAGLSATGLFELAFNKRDGFTKSG